MPVFGAGMVDHLPVGLREEVHVLQDLLGHLLLLQVPLFLEGNLQGHGARGQNGR